MNDLNGYVKKMENTINQKMFFLDELNVNEYDLIVDFGCGSGELLRRTFDSGYKNQAIGFDSNLEMLELAKRNTLNYPIQYEHDISVLTKSVEKAKKSLIIFSSVLHEITGRSLLSVTEFMSRFDTIVIRDMYFNEDIHLGQKFEDFKVGADTISSIYDKVSRSMIKDFELRYGSLTSDIKNFYHFLLKHTYVENWETEVEEYYFSLSLPDLNYKLKQKGFVISHFRSYGIDYIKNMVLDKFNYNMKANTHVNIIFKKGE